MPMAPSEAPAPESSVAPTVKVSFQPRQSCRLRVPNERFEDQVFMLENHEPLKYTYAMMGLDSVKWQTTMESEIEFTY